jgi:hypothetical protein
MTSNVIRFIIGRRRRFRRHAAPVSEKLFTGFPAPIRGSRLQFSPTNSLRDNTEPADGIANAKLMPGKRVPGGVMKQEFKTSLLEKIPVLILLGILAGAIGGLGIGVIQMKSPSSASAGR